MTPVGCSAPTCSAWAPTGTGGAATSSWRSTRVTARSRSLAPHALGLLNVEADHLDHYGTLGGARERLRAVRRTHQRTGRALERRRGMSARRAHRHARRRARRHAATTRVAGERRRRRRATQSRFTLHGPDVELAADACTSRAPTTSPTRRSWRSWPRSSASRPRRSARARELRGRPSAIRTAWVRGAASTSTRVTRTCPARSRRSCSATRAAGYERITAVFQPHRVTRTLVVGR